MQNYLPPFGKEVRWEIITNDDPPKVVYYVRWVPDMFNMVPESYMKELLSRYWNENKLDENPNINKHYRRRIIDTD